MILSLAVSLRGMKVKEQKGDKKTSSVSYLLEGIVLSTVPWLMKQTQTKVKQTCPVTIPSP